MKVLKVFLMSFFITLSLSKDGTLMDREKDIINLEQKIGRLLMVGFQGKMPADEEVQKLHSLLEQKKLGGVILYKHNIDSPEQLLSLAQYLHEANQDAFLAVDQEGGLVQRLVSSRGFNIKTPKADEVAETYLDPEQARNLYCLMAEELSKYFINLNFAPVVDLNNPEYPSPAIGKYGRSYGNDPERVAQFAQLVVEEHRKKKIATALKHFPGHGYSTEDTHHGIADTTKTANPEKELVPYEKLINSGHVDMVMTAHIVNEKYDLERYPATLSSQILPKLLREKLGYEGVVVSDDLHMGAINKYYKLDEVVTRALNATCDFLIFSNNLSETDAAAYQDLPTWKPDLSMVENIISLICQKVEEGAIPMARIDESYDRLQKLWATFQ